MTGLSFAVMAAGGGWFGFAAGQLLLGLSMGASNASEMGLRQQLTPDELQGRTAATVRSFNRAMIVIFAPIGGLLGEWFGYRWMLVASGDRLRVRGGRHGADKLPAGDVRRVAPARAPGPGPIGPAEPNGRPAEADRPLKRAPVRACRCYSMKQGTT